MSRRLESDCVQVAVCSKLSNELIISPHFIKHTVDEPGEVQEASDATRLVAVSDARVSGLCIRRVDASARVAPTPRRLTYPLPCQFRSSDESPRLVRRRQQVGPTRVVPRVADTSDTRVSRSRSDKVRLMDFYFLSRRVAACRTVPVRLIRRVVSVRPVRQVRTRQTSVERDATRSILWSLTTPRLKSFSDVTSAMSL